MKLHRSYFYSIIQGAIFILSLATDWYRPLVIILLATVLLSVLDKLGKGIVLRELISLHGCFVCLGMPALGYFLYNRTDYLARIWLKYMPIQENVYFSFALPAMAGFVFAISWPFTKKENSDEGVYISNLINKVKSILAEESMKNKGLYLLIVGIVAYFISSFLPDTFRFVSILLFFSSFAGVLYLYFSPSFAYKIPIILLFTLFIVANALRSGMFTIVAYMSITIISFLFIGNKIQFWKKIILFSLGTFILILIQSVKPAYRDYTWRNQFEGNRAYLFVNLLGEKLRSGNLFSQDEFFWIYYRTNQGFNVALVMRRIPLVQPYDGGVNLLRSAASSVVPRFLWPDKPEAGGKFNMKYYAGVTLKGWSTNIGPLGEAYGSFGATGGIIFMLCLGIFIRWAYKILFVIAKGTPLIICWLPVLFYQVTYSAETDTLQILNSLFKSAFFVWLLFKFFPSFFGKVKENVVQNPPLGLQGDPYSATGFRNVN